MLERTRHRIICVPFRACDIWVRSRYQEARGMTRISPSVQSPQVLREELDEIASRFSSADGDSQHGGTPLSDRLVGLAFSGGGIRSATFGLGVLQALKKLGLLEKVHYLSTVSGGGYIGSWLTAN